MHLFRSTDGGRTWQPVRLAVPPGVDSADRLTRIGTPVRDPAGTRLWLATAVSDEQGDVATFVECSADGGATWSVCGEPLIGWPVWAREDPRAGWDITGLQQAPMVFSTDGGRTWLIRMSEDLVRWLGTDRPADVMVDALSTHEAWVVLRNEGQDDLRFHTRDGGEHWEQLAPR
ncbi:MAG: exo-alpha-sialidase [Firmicutes bacterium]|nr:exo-alpha-sialidase [Bacillota bacterium]